MKKNYWQSATDRTALMIILVCMAILAAGSVLGIIYLNEYGFYQKGDDGKTAKSVAVQLYSLEDIDQVQDYYKCVTDNSDEYRLNYYKTKYSPEKSNFIFTIEDEDGTVLFSNFDTMTEHLKFDAEYTGSAGFYFYGEEGKIIPLRINYRIHDDHNSANDKYNSAFMWIELANSLKYALFIFCVLAIVVIIMLLSVMTVNAGITEEGGEVKPGFIDRIPLDLWIIFISFILFVCWVVIGLTAAGNVGMVLNNVVIMISFAVFIVILQLFLSTLSVRVKLGKFYKNTIVYFIYRKFKTMLPRKVHRTLREMSIFKKIILGISIYIIIEAAIMLTTSYFVFVSNMFDKNSVFGVFLVIWGTTRLILIPIIAMIAINLHYVKEEGQRLAQGVLGDEISSKLTVSAIRAHGKNLDLIRKEITKSMEQEIRSEKLKSELITNVSHDLKTPLTSIINYTELLKGDSLSDAERKNYISILSNHTDRLASLLNDLIEASQITSGNIDVVLEKTSLNIILAQTIDEFSYKLEQSELLPRVETPEEDVYIMGDGKWLWRTLSNLMNNACKYAVAGTDLLMKIQKSKGKAVLNLTNQYGAELNLDEADLLERFVRGDGSRHTEGNGLGLSIAKSLTEIQGGKMILSAADNIFSVTLEFDAVD